MNLKRSSIFSKPPAMTNTLNISRRQRLQMKHNVAGNHISWHFSPTTIYQGLQGITLICPCPGNWIIIEYFEERLFLMAKHLFLMKKISINNNFLTFFNFLVYHCWILFLRILKYISVRYETLKHWLRELFLRWSINIIVNFYILQLAFPFSCSTYFK